MKTKTLRSIISAVATGRPFLFLSFFPSGKNGARKELRRRRKRERENRK